MIVSQSSFVQQVSPADELLPDYRAVNSLDLYRQFFNCSIKDRIRQLILDICYRGLPLLSVEIRKKHPVKIRSYLHQSIHVRNMITESFQEWQNFQGDQPH